MRPTAFTLVSPEAIQSIIHRHRLRAGSFSLQPWVGGGSCVYQLGDDFVLKVPHGDPNPIESVHIEAVASRAARAAKVRTPRLVVVDDTLDLLPVPFLVYQRVHGELLAERERPPSKARDVWHDVGRDLALAHTSVRSDESLQLLSTFDETPATDPRPWVEDVQQSHGLTSAEARWLVQILDELAPAVIACASRCFCHGDVNATNIMVGRSEPWKYASLLDWGGAGWGDPANDFSGVSLRNVPFVLKGYREVTPLEDDDTAEARILWFYLRLALFGLKRNPTTESERSPRIERLLVETYQFLRRPELGYVKSG